jgi:hypothetical protein
MAKSPTYLLLRKSIRVIIGYPLVVVPGNPLHTSFLVPDRLHVVVTDDILDLLVVEYSHGITTRSRICAATELANPIGRVARWIFESERAAILHVNEISGSPSGASGSTAYPSLAKNHFVCLDTCAPKKIKTKVNLSQIGMRCDV